MGTIDGPKPTEPKEPIRGQRPLQPGQTDDGAINEPKPSEPFPQNPSIQKEEYEDIDDRRRR